jgi:hypothetical protein
MVFSLSSFVHAAFEHESLARIAIDRPILDVTTNETEDMIFVLTPGEVLIFLTGKDTILDRIPVDKDLDRIAYQRDDKLVLTASKPSKLDIVKFSRIYEIETTKRPFKGNPKAKLTLIVFDDYQ